MCIVCVCVGVWSVECGTGIARDERRCTLHRSIDPWTCAHQSAIQRSEAGRQVGTHGVPVALSRGGAALGEDAVRL